MKQSGRGTYGGFDAQAQNQQLLEDEEQGPGAAAAGPSQRDTAPMGIQGCV